MFFSLSYVEAPESLSCRRGPQQFMDASHVSLGPPYPDLFQFGYRMLHIADLDLRT
jgi:hypothetical protein